MPSIVLMPPWRVLPGFAFGLAQPPLIGRITVAEGSAARAAAFDDLLCAHVATPPPPASIDSPRALVERLVFWAGELQRQARIAVAGGAKVFAVASDDPARHAFDVALPVRDATVAAALLRELAGWANTLLAQPAPDAAALAALAEAIGHTTQRLRRRGEPGFNQFHLLQAAQRLDLPVNLLEGRKWRLGTGCHTRLVESTRSDRTAAIGLELAQSKRLTARLLAERGLPVPLHRLVDSADAAEAAALEIGFPVVVKPDDQDQGRGVAAHLASAAEVREAYGAARALSAAVLVERHVDGFGHRLTVADGRLFAALKRGPGGVAGDGALSIRALLERQLERPEVRRSLKMGRVALDDEALALLAAQGLTPESVPAAGSFVRLRRRDNLSAGGTLEHLACEAVHPDNQRLAVRAAEALFLDVAGVDLVTTDIGRSWRETGAVVCEVNGTPQIGAGANGDHHDRLLARLFPHGARIPVHLLLCGHADGAALSTQLAALARRLGIATTACRAAVLHEGEALATNLADGAAAARVALFDRGCRALLFALTPREVLAVGLPLDRVDAVHVAAQDDWPDEERRSLRTALVYCAAPVVG